MQREFQASFPLNCIVLEKKEKSFFKNSETDTALQQNSH